MTGGGGGSELVLLSKMAAGDENNNSAVNLVILRNKIYDGCNDNLLKYASTLRAGNGTWDGLVVVI